jgi:hypothetical protein
LKGADPSALVFYPKFCYGVLRGHNNNLARFMFPGIIESVVDKETGEAVDNATLSSEKGKQE